LAEIREEVVTQLGPIVKTTPAQVTRGMLPKVVLGVWIVGGDKFWARNITGEGLLDSDMDAGVRGGREILKLNFRREYGWFDHSGRSAAPRNENGHGTHTMGTIAGWFGNLLKVVEKGHCKTLQF
jgi:subtilisin family serine protease